MSDPLRIVLAEDSVLLREGLIRLLQEAGHTVVGAVGNALELVPSPWLMCGCRRPSPTTVSVPPSRLDVCSPA